MSKFYTVVKGSSHGLKVHSRTYIDDVSQTVVEIGIFGAQTIGTSRMGDAVGSCLTVGVADG